MRDDALVGVAMCRVSQGVWESGGRADRGGYGRGGQDGAVSAGRRRAADQAYQDQVCGASVVQCGFETAASFPRLVCGLGLITDSVRTQMGAPHCTPRVTMELHGQGGGVLLNCTHAKGSHSMGCSCTMCVADKSGSVMTVACLPHLCTYRFRS